MKEFQLSVPKPCEENWDKMDTLEQGRFCSSCQQEVIDFSKMSKAEIVNVLTKNENVCGRFEHQQLKEIYKQPQIIPFKIATKVVSVIGLSLTALTTSYASHQPKVEMPKAIVERNVNAQKKQDQLQLIVKVTNNHGQTIGGAIIEIEGFSEDIITNAQGLAYINLKKKHLKEDVLNIKVKYSLYEPIETTISTEFRNKVLNIEFQGEKLCHTSFKKGKVRITPKKKPPKSKKKPN